MKIIIGLAGRTGCGKSEVAKFLYNKFESNSEIVRVSDVLKRTLRLWEQPVQAESMQKVSDFLRATFGEDTLSKIVANKINSTDSEVVIVDGIRGKNIGNLIRSLPNSYIIYIETSERDRFDRIKNRNKKENEINLELEKFKSLQSHRTEAETPELKELADLKIVNDGTIAELQEKINTFIKSLT